MSGTIDRLESFPPCAVVFSSSRVAAGRSMVVMSRKKNHISKYTTRYPPLHSGTWGLFQSSSYTQCLSQVSPLKELASTPLYLQPRQGFNSTCFACFFMLAFFIIFLALQSLPAHELSIRLLSLLSNQYQGLYFLRINLSQPAREIK